MIAPLEMNEMAKCGNKDENAKKAVLRFAHDNVPCTTLEIFQGATLKNGKHSTFSGKFKGVKRIFGVIAIAESDVECPTCDELVKGSAIMITDIGTIIACKGCKIYTLLDVDTEEE